MSADPDSVPCECGHMRGIHKTREPRECAKAVCGCGSFRVRTPGTSPEPPRVVPGRVERELPAASREPEPAERAVARFAVWLRARMRATGMDAPALAAKTGLNPMTVSRAANGTSVSMHIAEQLADTLGVSLAAMIGPYSCRTCNSEPPAGFRCMECGTEATGARR